MIWCTSAPACCGHMAWCGRPLMLTFEGATSASTPSSTRISSSPSPPTTCAIPKSAAFSGAASSSGSTPSSAGATKTSSAFSPASTQRVIAPISNSTDAATTPSISCCGRPTTTWWFGSCAGCVTRESNSAVAAPGAETRSGNRTSNKWYRRAIICNSRMSSTSTSTGSISGTFPIWRRRKWTRSAQSSTAPRSLVEEKNLRAAPFDVERHPDAHVRQGLLDGLMSVRRRQEEEESATTRAHELSAERTGANGGGIQRIHPFRRNAVSKPSLQLPARVQQSSEAVKIARRFERLDRLVRQRADLLQFVVGLAGADVCDLLRRMVAGETADPRVPQQHVVFERPQVLGRHDDRARVPCLAWPHVGHTQTAVSGHDLILNAH